MRQTKGEKRSSGFQAVVCPRKKGENRKKVSGCGVARQRERREIVGFRL